MVQGAEDHPDNPEEDNIVTGHQGICGEELVEISRLFWPPQRGERPQSR